MENIGLFSRLLKPLFKQVFGRAPGRLMFLTGLFIVLVFVFMVVLAPLISPYDPTDIVDEPFLPPSPKHLMGTNRIGQDIFSRIVWGSRIILYVVFAATALSMAMGIPLGLVSGYIGGKLDRVLSMVMDSMYSFPALILAIAIAAVLGPSPTNTAIAIAFVYVPTYFRMIRGQTLSVKAQLYIDAAKALGIPSKRIMIRHILPNLGHTILVVFTLSVADAILTEAGLSYIGLSVTPPTPDWGYDLRAGQPFLIDGMWWLVFFPGISVMLLAMGFALIGEALSERISLAQTR